MTVERPLAGYLVLDFSQFLAGPVAALRLADLGTRVVKIERPETGDAGRQLAFAGLETDGDTLSFHAMNRGKESFVADLKDPRDLADVRRLVERADVIVQNFRPGVMERIGLDYEQVRRINPRIVYGSITGYGNSGPWRDLPGQDLLAQAVSGLPWLSGDREDGPIPVGLALADSLASCHLAQGITALLLRRERTGVGGLVETSLLEGMFDLQFELLTAHLHDPTVLVRRGAAHSAHAFLPAPYGIYPTADGHLAIAMNPVPRIGELLGIAALTELTDPRTWWTEQDAITDTLVGQLKTQRTQHWLDILLPAGVWCAPMQSLPDIVTHEGFRALDMTQSVARRGESGTVRTTRSPLRVDGEVIRNPVGAPRLGADNAAIQAEMLGDDT